jgi:hypothetical protein
MILRSAQLFLLLMIVAGTGSAVRALPVKIESGSLLIGGTQFDTPDYQTYLEFDLNGRSEMPRRIYRMSAEQPYSVYLNFPSQPDGAVNYRLVMPYGPQRLSINGAAIYPVWYGDCIWNLSSTIAKPLPTATPPPQFMVVSSPFSMSGTTIFFGGRSGGFKTVGHGTLQVQFEFVGREYYTRAARFTFGDEEPTAGFTK